MRTADLQLLQHDPALLSQCVAAGEMLLITNECGRASIVLPLHDSRIAVDVSVQLAIALYEEGTLTLVTAAHLAKMGTEQFLEKLAMLGILAPHQPPTELLGDLDALKD